MWWDATFRTTSGRVNVILRRVPQKLTRRKARTKRRDETIFRLGLDWNSIHLPRRPSYIVNDDRHDDPRGIEPQINQYHDCDKGWSRGRKRFQVVRVGKDALRIGINQGRTQTDADRVIEQDNAENGRKGARRFGHGPWFSIPS
jgi:hypothetical protein